jgi:hypothetical protein
MGVSSPEKNHGRLCPKKKAHGRFCQIKIKNHGPLCRKKIIGVFGHFAHRSTNIPSTAISQKKTSALHGLV